MIHYVYATRGGYLYLMGKHSQLPKLESADEFVLSVPDKMLQGQIDTLAHRRFVEHLRKPRKVVHDRHRKGEGSRELVTA